MFKQYLKEEFPFATNFFESALKHGSDKFFHSFLLTGSNPVAQYDLVLEIARYLNCQNKEHFETCECLNCKWIKENKHPAVITISPIDYLEGHSDGKPKSVISVDQIRHLKNALSLTSPYHRIIIFTGAEEKNEEVDTPFSPPTTKDSDEKRNWLPTGLSQKIFKASPSNAILKSIEEPNDKVTFFFLTSNKDDMLPTIISRSQCINVISNKIPSLDISPVENLVQKIPPRNEAEAVILAQEFIDLSKSYTLDSLLDMLLEHFKRLLEKNSENKINAMKIINIIQKINKAKLESLSYVSSIVLLESLFLSLIKK